MIPIEKGEVGKGWVLTCCGQNGKDFTLSVVSIEKGSRNYGRFIEEFIMNERCKENMYHKASIANLRACTPFLLQSKY